MRDRLRIDEFVALLPSHGALHSSESRHIRKLRGSRDQTLSTIQHANMDR